MSGSYACGASNSGLAGAPRALLTSPACHSPLRAQEALTPEEGVDYWRLGEEPGGDGSGGAPRAEAASDEVAGGGEDEELAA